MIQPDLNVPIVKHPILNLTVLCGIVLNVLGNGLRLHLKEFWLGKIVHLVPNVNKKEPLLTEDVGGVLNVDVDGLRKVEEVETIGLLMTQNVHLVPNVVLLTLFPAVLVGDVGDVVKAG